MAAVSIAIDLSLKPQSRTILRHLRNNDHITPAQALIVYGISRLAACIYDLREAGYDVAKKTKRDAQGHIYASYSMAKVH